MLSFVMPTLNGFTRINLVCSWLHHQQFRGKLVVVDGSKKKHNELAELWDFVTYIHIPDCSTQSAQFHGFQNVETPFACLIGDDDLPILNGCDKCINFLLKNNDFGAAHGASSFLDFEKTQNIFERKAVLNFWYCLKTFFSGRYDRNSDYSADAYLERIREFHANYIVAVFCVARTSLVKKVNNNIINELNDVHLGEILSSFGYIISARIKKLPDLYLLRGLGSHRPNAMATASRHTDLDLKSANKYAREYLLTIGADEQVRTVCLALLITLRLKGFLKSSTLSLGRTQAFSRYFVQQIRRLKLSASPSNLVKISFLYWLKKQK